MSLRGMMVAKVKAIDYDKLNKLASDIGKRNNKSKGYVKRDMFLNFIKYGIGYTDYLKSDYINLTKEDKKNFVTTKSYYKILNYLNDPKYVCTMADKLLFNRIFKEYLGREFIDLRTTSVDDFKKFIKGKKHIFAKPPLDFGGHGIEKISVKDIKDVNKLYKELKKKKLNLVEEEIIQHPIVEKLNPYAVNSFRIVTLVNDGKAYILANALRINIDDAIAIGCNDAYMKLDEDGNLISPVVDDLANIYETHPVTGVKFSDLKIPYVKESFDMALKAALEVPEVRYVGWDFAITEKGPVIVEGNEYPSYGLVQYYLLNKNNVGHLKQIKDIIGDEINNIKL